MYVYIHIYTYYTYTYKYFIFFLELLTNLKTKKTTVSKLKFTNNNSTCVWPWRPLSPPPYCAVLLLRSMLNGESPY